MISVYISNRYVRVAEGEGKGENIRVKDLYVTEDQRGCVLNGVLTDPEGFGQLIGEMWETFRLPKKGVRLVIDGNQFNTKLLEIPKQKPRQMLTFVSREFTDVDRMEDPVYGYFPMTHAETPDEISAADGKKKAGKKEKKTKKQKTLKLTKVFAAAASREYVRSFTDIFESLGISVSSVETSRGAAIRLTEILETLKGQTCIVQFADDMVLQNVLLDRGSYVYASRTRMFSEPGTADFAIETARTVSNILQFAQAEKLPEPIRTVYVAGIDPELMDLYCDSVSRVNPELSARWLSTGNAVSVPAKYGDPAGVSAFALAIGGLAETDQKTNIFVQAKADPKAAERKSLKAKKLVPLCILAGVMAITVLALGGRLLSLKARIRKVQDYTQNEQNLAACQEFDEKNTRLAALASFKRSMENLDQSVCQYPLVDSSVNQQLLNCAAGLVEATVMGYSSEDGMLSFQTTAANTDNINKFISILNAQEMFETVDYSGYTQDSTGNWSVNVFCTMAARGEEE